MYFSKIAHPANFSFAGLAEPATGTLALGGRRLELENRSLGGDVHRIRVRGGAWAPHGSHAVLSERIDGSESHRVVLRGDASLALETQDDAQALIEGVSAATFGVCGSNWMFQFRCEEDMQFYGLGEHSQGLDKRGQRAKFWNTDLFGDFAHSQISDGYANPMYVAIPWVIVKRGNRYAGILVNNPGAVFMDLGSNFVWNADNTEDLERKSFYVGAPDGEPELYLIAGPDLPSLLRRLQALVGRTPLPPLWALGHQQCRWGYAGIEDLNALDVAFREHRIPCDGLWLDIDYMEGYRVFTYAEKHWGGTPRVRAALASLAERGRRVVPILDPGVKCDKDYEVCRDGLDKDVFCLTPEGKPYVGFVWPGRTYMPDYSLPETREWWAGRVQELAGLGFAASWIDMNDPSVGAVELDEMRFNHGRQPHAYYHNQYALGMAQATRDGFVRARPEERPFLLSRSAFISSSRYTAVWTGDNVSNWHHLRLSIPVSLGLALSGLPFNGPDIAGFMGNTTPELAVAWYKACFLFPFCRNHSSAATRPQEPWALGMRACETIGHYIRLRYKLLPYLYQLFIAQEARGEAILRPLFHDFSDSEALPLGRIEDQFLIGPDILQAPIVSEGAEEREVVLPGDKTWYAAHVGAWEEPGRRRTKAASGATPLYVREGALIPMQQGERETNANDLGRIELHCFLRRGSNQVSSLDYSHDDGISLAYRSGARSTVRLEARGLPDGGLSLSAQGLSLANGGLALAVRVYDDFNYILLRDASGERRLELRSRRWRITGTAVPCRGTESVLLSLEA